MENEQKGYWQLISYSVLAALVGVIVKSIKDLDIYSIIFFRAIIASIFILIILILTKKIKELTLVSPVKTILVGLFQGISIFLYFNAILNTSITNAVFLLYTAPLFTLIFAKIFFKEKIEKVAIFGVAITLLGIACILNPKEFSFNLSQSFGNLMGLGAGLFYSMMTLTAKSIKQNVSGYYIVFWQYLVIAIVFAIFANFHNTSILVNLPKLLLIGIVCSGIAFVLFMEGVRKVKAQKIFVITSLEPFFATIYGLIFLKEIPPFFTLIGAALILFGVYKISHKSKL